MDTNISSLFLVSTGVFIGVLIGAIVVVGAGAFLIGYFLNKKTHGKESRRSQPKNSDNA